MARLGVPIVDAAQIVQGQAWASRRSDGRHYHPIVPLETFALLGALISPPPPPLLAEGEETAREEANDIGPHLSMVDEASGAS